MSLVENHEILMFSTIFLGYITNEPGIRPSAEHVTAVNNFPIPHNFKDI